MVTLVLIGLVGGMITGISPCILPVLPVVFLSSGVRRPEAGTRRKGRPAPPVRNRRPYLIVAGLALSFSVFTLLGTLVLKALPLPADIIRWAGLVVLVLLGAGLVWPRLQHLLAVIPDQSLPESRTPGPGGFCGEIDLHHDHAGGADLLTVTFIDHAVVQMQAGASKSSRGNGNS